MTTTCTYHCSACRLHFHLLRAFDAHRAGSYESGRRCEHPLDLDGRLVELTTDGVCSMYPNRIERSVVVWTHAGDIGRIERFVAAQRLGEAESGIGSEADLAA